MATFDQRRGCECREESWTALFRVKSDGLANLLPAKNVVYSSVWIQLRAFGASVNFVARLKDRMLGLHVVPAVSSPRFWVTHSPPSTGVLSNSLFLPRPLGCLRDQLSSPLILEKSTHPKWVILGFSSYCLHCQCFNQCVFVCVCVRVCSETAELINNGRPTW